MSSPLLLSSNMWYSTECNAESFLSMGTSVSVFPRRRKLRTSSHISRASKLPNRLCTPLDFNLLKLAVQARLVPQDGLFHRAVSRLNAIGQQQVVHEHEGQVLRRNLPFRFEQLGRIDYVQQNGFICESLFIPASDASRIRGAHI